jgi:hypothetical protein
LFAYGGLLFGCTNHSLINYLEINERLANEKKQGLCLGIRTMALRFQFGFDLVADKRLF